jgi:glycosyltransferase involved in cell wall biosynthesis
VAETLQSVFAQTYKDFEVVLVNDGSPDTAELEQAIAPWRDRLTYQRTADSLRRATMAFERREAN